MKIVLGKKKKAQAAKVRAQEAVATLGTPEFQNLPLPQKVDKLVEIVTDLSKQGDAPTT